MYATQFLNFRGYNASIFVIFFFNRPKILRGFHFFFALEHPKIKSKGRTARTMAVVCFSLHLSVLFSAGLAASGMYT